MENGRESTERKSGRSLLLSFFFIFYFFISFYWGKRARNYFENRSYVEVGHTPRMFHSGVASDKADRFSVLCQLILSKMLISFKLYSENSIVNFSDNFRLGGKKVIMIISVVFRKYSSGKSFGE